ncbi:MULTISPECIES: DUF3085 domain-containing protein [Enterobacterales]|uniref:DUF3085 domain-containing protein n=1 Tax=Enterobacterales TaxID=91347 RepID=UPI001CFE842A|nr:MULTISPECIES: DUF3085 domain-containing protein [Enterobacterales]MCB5308770.1 DUF3085 domain-containing protein [Yersinia massiliensis]
MQTIPPQSEPIIFKAEALIPIINEAMVNDCELILVKDHGLYIMSQHGQKNGKGHFNVAYAEGFNAELIDFDDWYDKLIDICGGDDFGEYINPKQPLFEELVKMNRDLKITFTPTAFFIELL